MTWVEFEHLQLSRPTSAARVWEVSLDYQKSVDSLAALLVVKAGGLVVGYPHGAERAWFWNFLGINALLLASIAPMDCSLRVCFPLLTFLGFLPAVWAIANWHSMPLAK